MVFKIGDQVRWVHGVLESNAKNASGTIIAVIPNDTGVDDFTLYDVAFDFGTFTLYGGQIEPEGQNEPSHFEAL